MIRPTRVRAFAPATVANVGCGLDVFGFALDGLGDEVVAEYSERPGVEIRAIHGDPHDVERLPRGAQRNTAGAAVLALLRRLGSGVRPDVGVCLELDKRMPLSSGLGSSAASGVAALVATSRLLELDIEPEMLFACALEAEAVACGSAHADNAAPSLLGGFVLARRGTGSQSPPDIVPLPVPEGLACAIVRPHVEVETRGARALLGQSVPLTAAVTQWGNTAGLVAAMFRGDLELLGRCLHDAVAEPKRAPLVPGFRAACEAGRAAGALGCGLSGSGPSTFALCASRAIAEEAATAMVHAFEHSAGLDSDRLVSAVGAPGARVTASD